MLKLREHILSDRYFWKTQDYVETNESQMYQRVAYAVGYQWGEKEVKKFYNLLSEKRFAPNSPVFFNAPPSHYKNKSFMGSACFVISLDDHMDSIMDTAKEMALIFKYGGGVGLCVDKLRPEGAFVNNGTSVSSGPISFMKIYNEVAGQVMQGGKRRAALLISLDWRHPDIEKFITCKDLENSLTNMNISIKLDNEFFDNLGKIYECKFKYNDGKHVFNRSFDIDNLYNLIIDYSWKNGEPGILFFDNIEKGNPVPSLPITSTNPCGEQPLPDYGACNLGSINLAHPDCIVGGKVSYEYISKVAYDATKFLNGVLINYDMKIIPKIEQFVKKDMRNIGLGVTGFSELLINMGVVYGSEESLRIIDIIGNAILEGSVLASSDLAKENPKYVFKNYEKSKWKSLTDIKDMHIIDKTLIKKIQKDKMANATLTCIAPTGTISILLNTTCSGIEPPFLNVYERKFRVKDGWDKDICALIPKNIKEEDVIKNKGTLKGLVPDNIYEIYKTAIDILPINHLNVLAQFQKYMHAGVSKTVNLPYEFTKDELKDFYKIAHSKGVKGITIYRDKSRDVQILSSIKQEDNTISLTTRPINVKGETYRIVTEGDRTIYITMNTWNGDENKIREIFINAGKQGNEFNAMCSALGRIISICLQSNPELLQRIVDTLKGNTGDIIGNTYVMNKTIFFYSLVDLIGKLLEAKLVNSKKNETNVNHQQSESTKIKTLRSFICPKCFSINVTMTESCTLCLDCNWSKCS